MALKWIEWQPIPGAEHFSAQPIAVSTGSGRIDLFTTGSKAQILHNWWGDNKWHEWKDLGGEVKTNPTVLSRGPGLVDIFCIGTDNRMYHNPWTLTKESPDGFKPPVGGVINPGWPLSVVSWGPKGSNRIDVFAVGTKNNLLHLYTNDGNDWGPKIGGVPTWEDLGGELSSQPVAVSWAENRLDIFALGTDRQMYHKWWDHTQGKWMPSKSDWQGGFPGILFEAPTVISRAPNNLDIFARGPGIGGSGERMYHLFWDGSGWGPAADGKMQWEDLGDPTLNCLFESAPVVISRAAGLIDILAIGRDARLPGSIKVQTLFYKAWDNGWKPPTYWDVVEGSYVYGSKVWVRKPCAAAMADNSVMAVASGQDSFAGFYYTAGFE